MVNGINRRRGQPGLLGILCYTFVYAVNGKGNVVKKETHNCLGRGYSKEVAREIRGLEYFDETDLLFYWKETLKGIMLLKRRKVVNLTDIRRLYIGLVAIEITIRERMSPQNT